MPSAERVIRIAAVGDLHCTSASQGIFQALMARINEAADLLLLPGDLLNYGLPEEAEALVKEMAPLKIPAVAVLGNHDVESGHVAEITSILTRSGMVILDGSAFEHEGVGIAGVKGFIGGFDEHSLQPWGEASVKSLVHETVEEALRLERALASLRTPHRLALMHYAPIKQTVVGEPLEIYPFLGSSRLEEPLHRYPVAAVFHGHAHRGGLEGRLGNGVPVYNVSHSLLSRCFPDRPPFRILELPVVSDLGPAVSGATVEHGRIS